MPKGSDRKSIGPLQLSSLLGSVTKEAFKKRGFAEGRLITDWTEIVGKELANHCSPIKISFNKGARADGTLHINVYGSVATELQHMEPLIIERISTYFGYQAVSKIKLIHGEVKKTAVKSPTSAYSASRKVSIDDQIIKKLDDINDPSLKAALAGLGENMLARNSWHGDSE